MAIILPQSDDSRRILLDRIYLMARPESGKAIVRLDGALIHEVKAVHDEFVQIQERHAAALRKVVEVEEDVTSRMVLVRSMLSAHWAVLREYRKQGDAYADVLDYYGYQDRPISRMRDLDIVRALKRIINALSSQEANAGSPQTDADQSGKVAKEVAIPVIQAFPIMSLQAAVEGLEEDLVFVLEVRGGRSVRASELNVVRKRAQMAMRRVAASIRLACIEESLVQKREKLRAFGFNVPLGPGSSPEEQGDVASNGSQEPQPQDSESESSEVGTGQLDVEGLASQG